MQTCRASHGVDPHAHMGHTRLRMRHTHVGHTRLRMRHTHMGSTRLPMGGHRCPSALMPVQAFSIFSVGQVAWLLHDGRHVGICMGPTPVMKA
eukprot:323709-Chlamydomonas_euryale.AAC.2